MTRLLTPAILMCLACILAWELASGRAYLYIHDRSTWLIALSIPVLFLLGLSTFLKGQRTVPHARIWGGVAFLPALIALAIPARPLGSAAFDVQQASARPGTALAGLGAPLSLEPSNRTWDIKQLGLLQLGETAPSNLDGQQADLIGFVHHSQELQDGEFEVARFLVRCCTADAVAVSVPVRYDRTPDLQRDSWVEVRGTIRVTQTRNAQPFIDPASVQVIAEPSHPYLQLP